MAQITQEEKDLIFGSLWTCVLVGVASYLLSLRPLEERTKPETYPDLPRRCCDAVLPHMREVLEDLEVSELVRGAVSAALSHYDRDLTRVLTALHNDERPPDVRLDLVN